MEARKPFLITGLGASATKFLAMQLDKSPTWTVYHEPNVIRLRDPSPRYGVIDSNLRHHHRACNDFLSMGRLAVITRDPRDIAEHCIAKGTWNQVRSELKEDLERLDYLLRQGAHHLKFSHIITSPGLLNAASWCGIDDLPFPEGLTPVGHVERFSDQISVRRELASWPVVHQFIHRYVES